MNRNRTTGFTLIELLTALGIVAILIALLLPALKKVRALAFDIKQKGQINAVEIAIEAYNVDFGRYPSSGNVGADNIPKDETGFLPYYGSEKLAEALLGYDLLGVHKNVPVNFSKTGNDYTPLTPANLAERKGPYLEADKMSPVESISDEDIFNLMGGGHYISDVYGRDNLKMGLPLLYYKARPEKKVQNGTFVVSIADKVYDYRDSNMPFDNVSGELEMYTQGYTNIWGTSIANAEAAFDVYVTNNEISSDDTKIPFRPQSYLLISAGADGVYGTVDDVCNFERK